MKTRVATYIVIIIATTLLIYNQTLISKLKNCSTEYDELYLNFKDLKERHKTTIELYDMQRDEVLRLEEENQILGSAAAINTVIYND